MADSASFDKKPKKAKRIKKLDFIDFAYWDEVYLPKVYVKGFDLSRPQDELKKELTQHFSCCGTVSAIAIVDSVPDRGLQGYAAIMFSDGEEAKKAIFDLNKSFMGGFRLSVKEPYSKKEMKQIRYELATEDIDVLGFSEDEEYTSEDDVAEPVPVIKELSKKGKREHQAVLEKSSRKRQKKQQAVLEKSSRKKLKKQKRRKLHVKAPATEEAAKLKIQLSGSNDSSSKEGGVGCSKSKLGC